MQIGYAKHFYLQTNNWTLPLCHAGDEGFARKENHGGVDSRPRGHGKLTCGISPNYLNENRVAM
jgi:hypothetical protein